MGQQDNDVDNKGITEVQTNLDYSNILLNFNLSYNTSVFYYEVGNIENKQGWVIFLPISIFNFEKKANEIIPYLLSENIAFKIPITKEAHHGLLQGLFGNEHLGKVICIYVSDQSKLLSISMQLIGLTKSTKGSSVPSAVNLGGLVYTRYQNFLPVPTIDGEAMFNEKGQLIKDEYSVPYAKPNWSDWPFNALIKFPEPIAKRKLNNKYLIINVLKSDPKGKVIHAMYHKGLLHFPQCFIKEGRRGLFEDEYSRDMRDRILWQKKLHEKIKGKISVPGIIDCFEDEDSTYLVMDFINGRSLDDFQNEIFQYQSWLFLPTIKKTKILDKLIEILLEIEKLHNLGFVHRDISIANFMVDKHDKIYLIDLELAYELDQTGINPPFKGGTDGYLSPEQSQQHLPAKDQDIYSLGVLIMVSLIRLVPQKFARNNINELRKNLTFFINDYRVVDLIIQCIDKEPAKRPKIEILNKEIQEYRNRIVHNKALLEFKFDLNNDEIINLIHRGINGLNYNGMLNAEGIWSSPIKPFREDRAVFIGLYKGISGIIYFLSTAKKNGLSVGNCFETLQKNLNVLINHFLKNTSDFPPGLYHNCNGIAIAISTAIDADVLPNDSVYTNLITSCLDKFPTGYDLENGVAGYGIAILKCAKYLDEKFKEEKLKQCIENLITSQSLQGYWITINESQKNKEIFTGFERGVAGINCFLLNYLQSEKLDKVEAVVINSLNWLQKKAITKNNFISWKKSNLNNEELLFLNGSAGIALIFIKAYEYFNNVDYKLFAEKILISIPNDIIINETTLNAGTAGLVCIYMEAFRIFKTELWLQRAKWIISVYSNTCSDDKEFTYWIQTDPYNPYADFLTGNSGIIYSMLSYKGTVPAFSFLS